MLGLLLLVVSFVLLVSSTANSDERLYITGIVLLIGSVMGMITVPITYDDTYPCTIHPIELMAQDGLRIQIITTDDLRFRAESKNVKVEPVSDHDDVNLVSFCEGKPWNKWWLAFSDEADDRYSVFLSYDQYATWLDDERVIRPGR